jgi:diguanylate cyclase (GGDEF)-like protein
MADSGGTSDRLQGVRVLVLDDEEVICQVIRTALTAHGAAVATATGGETALQRLLAEDFDLVTVDLRMPRFNGLAFMREARKIWPWLGFVVVTGAPQEDLLRQAREWGATRLLRKPFRIEALIEMVRAEADDCRGRLAARPAPSPERLRQYHRMLRHIAESASASHTFVEAMLEFQRGLDQIHPVDLQAVLGLEDGRGVFVARTSTPAARSELEDLARQAQTLYEALTGRPADAAPPRLLIEGPAADPSAVPAPVKPASVIMLPILEGDTLDGLLVLASRTEDLTVTLDLSFFLLAANTMSAVMAGLTRARHLATHDFLTGLGNRAYFEEMLKHELALSRRNGRPLALLLADLDTFKEINDTHGHAAGDAVLREFARLLLQETRASDSAVRYGGDEFAMLLPDTDREGGLTLARRLVDNTARRAFQHEGASLSLTVSIGLAGSWDLASDAPASQLPFLADVALYRAKREGRNAARAWEPGLTVTPNAPRPGNDTGAGQAGRGSEWGGLPEACRLVVSLLDAREPGHALHSRRVRNLALILGRAMGLEGRALEELGWAALLHDTGKIGVPESILLKSGPLSREERRCVEEHAELGARFAAAHPALAPAAELIRTHHERFDGTGYPRGLKGADIPLASRILAVADAYEALRSERRYRPAMTRAQATRHIQEGAERHFDPDVVKRFLACQEELEDAGRFEAGE